LTRLFILEYLYFFLHISLLFFLYCIKNHVTWLIKKSNKIKKKTFNIFLKNYHNLNSILLNGFMILSYSLGHAVVNLLPINFFLTCQFYKIISLLNIKKIIVYVYINLTLSEPSINHRLPFKISENLTSLKQRHFH
jgi:hypothetical protein